MKLKPVSKGHLPHLDSRRTPKASIVRFYLSRLKEELDKKGIAPDKHEIRPSEISRELSRDVGKIHLTTVTRIATSQGFKVSDSKKSVETDGSRRVKAYFKKLKEKLTEAGISLDKYKVFPTKVATKLSDQNVEVCPVVVSEYAKKSGFLVTTNEEAVETPASKIVKQYFNELEAQLKEVKISPGTYTVFPARIGRTLSSESLRITRLTVRREAVKRGFKIASNKESQIVSHETPSSRKVRDYVTALEEKLKAEGKTLAEITCYATDIAREISSEEITVGRATVKRAIERREGNVANLSQSRIKTFETAGSIAVRAYFSELAGLFLENQMSPSSVTIFPGNVKAFLLDTAPVTIENIRYVARSHDFKLASRREARNNRGGIPYIKKLTEAVIDNQLPTS